MPADFDVGLLGKDVQNTAAAAKATDNGLDPAAASNLFPKTSVHSVSSGGIGCFFPSESATVDSVI